VNIDPPPKRFVRQKPVAWLSPSQLARTGIRVVLAAVQGAYFDKRELQQSLPDVVHQELDTGDGFDATYSIAHLVAQPELHVDGHVLPGADVLVLGGDEVYPAASASEYENRFVGPFTTALPSTPAEHEPALYAIPGNHDWYDGLTAFLRLFASTFKCAIGGWRVPQTRSYFAVELPGDWWLFAVDDQGSAYFDDPQLNYFTRAAQRLTPRSRVIVATSQPTWVLAAQQPGTHTSTDFFVRHVIAPTGARVSLMISGDVHHYAHYTGPAGT
jgi:hypothetical protein